MFRTKRFCHIFIKLSVARIMKFRKYTDYVSHTLSDILRKSGHIGDFLKALDLDSYKLDFSCFLDPAESLVAIRNKNYM